MVMAFHFFLVTQPLSTSNRFEWAVDRVASFGWAGVDLFFVLSGFLITGILLDAKTSRLHYFRNFYARRCLRIVPLYYGYLIVMFGVVALFAASAEYRELQAAQGWFWLYLANMWYALHGGQAIDLYGTGHLWSLAVEEQFYLVWPAVVLMCRPRTLGYACAFVMLGSWASRAAMAQSGAPLFTSFTFTLSRADGLAAGALLAVLIRHRPEVVARLALPLAVISAATFAATVVAQGGTPVFYPAMQTFGMVSLVVLFASVIALELIAHAGWLHRLLRARILRFFGKHSYALYVVHWPIATWLVWHVDLQHALPGVGDSLLPGRILFTATALVGSLILSVVTWHVVEQPCIRLKRHFPQAEERPSALVLARVA